MAHHGGDVGWQSNSGLAVNRLELDREGSRFDSEGGWGRGLSKNRDLDAFFSSLCLSDMIEKRILKVTT